MLEYVQGIYLCTYVHTQIYVPHGTERNLGYAQGVHANFVFSPNWRALEISNLTLLEFVQGVHAGDGAVQENPR